MPRGSELAERAVPLLLGGEAGERENPLADKLQARDSIGQAL